jgi:hypothetical protein
MAILVLFLVVVAAFVIVRGFQNRPDLRGMSEHDRTMEALHKLADTPPAGTTVVTRPGRPATPNPALWELTRVQSAPIRQMGEARLPRQSPGRRVQRIVTVAGLLVMVSAAIAGFTTQAERSPSKASPHPATTVAHPTATVPAPAAPETPAPVIPIASLTPIKADARAANFVVGGGPFSIVVTAGGPCWMEVRDANRHVIFMGTLAPGETRQFQGTDLRLRLGAASNVSLLVNGSSLDLPVRTPDPYNVRVAQTA